MTNYSRTLVSGQEMKTPKCYWFCVTQKPGLIAHVSWKSWFTRPFPASSQSVNWELCWLARVVVCAFLPAARPMKGAIGQSRPRYLFTSKTWKTGERGVVLCEHEICSHISRLTVTWHPEHCVIRCHISKDSNNGNTKNTYFFSFRCAAVICNSNNIILAPLLFYI